ncbi:MAG: hypothetical protein ACRD2C_04190 [Acidimicrobiales bacterium]
MTSVYELAGAAWDQVEDTNEPCRCCGHELGVHDPGVGCDECSCVYGVDGWVLDDDPGVAR